MSWVNKPLPHERCSCGAEFFCTAQGMDQRERERSSFREAHAECLGRGHLYEAFRGGYERGVGAGKLSGNEAFADLSHHWQQWLIESGRANTKAKTQERG